MVKNEHTVSYRDSDIFSAQVLYSTFVPSPSLDNLTKTSAFMGLIAYLLQKYKRKLIKEKDMQKLRKNVSLYEAYFANF